MVLGRISLVAALLSLSGLGLCQDMFGRAESALSIYPECAVSQYLGPSVTTA